MTQGTDAGSFIQIRKTKRVSVFPVGMVTKLQLSSPVLNSEGIVVDYYDGYISNRTFPIDMAGFAVNTGFYRQVRLEAVHAL